MSLRCVHIESGLRVTNNGAIQPCCYFNPSVNYKDDNGLDLNVNSTSLLKAFDSPTLAKLREQFSRGERPDGCSRCWKEEDAGITSKRIRDNKSYDFRESTNTVRFLELNLGNTCNFACRMCGITASIKWYKEAKKLHYPHISDEEYDKYVKTMYKSYDDDSLFWKSVYDAAPTLEMIDMYGGEPFLVKKQWEFLKELINLGYSKNIRLHFNTNGSIFKEEYFEILDKFKFVNISFSIDGIEDKFNYIRHHGDWNQVLNNMNKWAEYSKGREHWLLDVCITISILNILDIGELNEFFKNNFPQMPLFLNQVSWPSYFSVKCIPNIYKGRITEKIVQYIDKIGKSTDEWPDAYNIKEQILNTVEFMNTNTGTEEDFLKFYKVNDLLDESRNQNFMKTFPELYSIFEPTTKV